MINKSQIETAISKTTNQVDIVMVSGQKFTANLQYGDLMFHLFGVSHTNDHQ